MNQPMLPPLHIKRSLFLFMAIALAYSLVADACDHLLDFPRWNMGAEVTAALASVLTILLAFRINAANARWWEARQLWGQLTNDLRNLSLKVAAHARVDHEERSRFARYLIAFPHALRNLLRGEETAAIPGLDHEPPAGVHLPGYIAGRVHETLGCWNREGKLHETIWVLDHHARALMDVSGACERIRNTLMPSSYRSLIRLAIVLFVFVSPWCATVDGHWWCTPVLAVSFFFLIGMELTATAVEEPFGKENDDLPLDLYCENIQKFILSVEPHALTPEPAKKVYA